MSRHNHQEDKNGVQSIKGHVVITVSDARLQKKIEKICRLHEFPFAHIRQTETAQLFVQCEKDCDLLILDSTKTSAEDTIDLALKVIDRYHLPVVILANEILENAFKYEFHRAMVHFVSKDEIEVALTAILKYVLPQARLMMKQSRSLLFNRPVQLAQHSMLIINSAGNVISTGINEAHPLGFTSEEIIGAHWRSIFQLENEALIEKIENFVASNDVTVRLEIIVVQIESGDSGKFDLQGHKLQGVDGELNTVFYLSPLMITQVYQSLHTGEMVSQQLLNFVEKLNQTNTYEEVYEYTIRCIRELFSTEMCVIDRYNQPRSLSFFHGLTANYEKQSLNFCPWEIDNTNAFPVSFLNIESSELPQFEKMLLAEEMVRSCVYFPLIGEKRIIGALIIYFTNIHALSQDEMKIGRALAHNLATTMRRIYSHSQFEESELKYQSIFDNVVEGIYQSTKTGKFITVNNALIKMLGYDSEEEVMALDLPVDIYLDPEIRHQLAKEVDDLGFLHDHQLQLKRKDGSVITVIMNDRAVHDANGKFLYYEGTLVDVTEKIRALAELEKSEKQLNAVINSSPDLIVLKDADGKWLIANSSARMRFGLENIDFIGKTDAELALLVPDNKDFFDVSCKFDDITWRRHHLIRYETVLYKGDVALHFDVVKVPSYTEEGKRWALVTIARDVTKIKQDQRKQLQLEKKIQKAQKHESLYILAGGIAHDFNNLLVSILGNAGLALLVLDEKTPLYESIKQIEVASQRAADLTKQLLAYSGKGKFVLEIVNLSDLVEEMAHLLEISISKDITLIYDFDKNLPPIEADPTQIRQVVMNLITNASEAIGKKWGRIHITTGRHCFNNEDLSNYLFQEDFGDGEYCYIEVRDTGCGMSEETLKKIFDPFYTTKFTGRGLGLAAVLGIVRGHNGSIKVESDEINGTTFRAIFPTSKKKIVDKKAPKLLSRDQYAHTTILVVDDEETVLNVTCRILRQYGFKVIAAQDGYEGLEQVKSGVHDISLVILDMTMPGLDGEATFREMRKVDPKLKIILSSGFSEQEATNKFSGKGLTGFIQKPYRPVELALKVQSVLPEFSSAAVIQPDKQQVPSAVPKFHTGDASKIFSKS